MYSTAAHGDVKTSWGAALRWDGVMYDDLNVAIAIGVDPITVVGCHLQPVVPCSGVTYFVRFCE